MLRGIAFLAILLLPITASAQSIAAPTCVISSPPGTIQAGSGTRIIWYSENASHAYLNGVGEVPLQGFQDVYPRINTTYTMTVTSPAGSRTCSALVTVAPASSVLYQVPVYQTTTLQPVSWTTFTVPPAFTTQTVTNTWYWSQPSAYWSNGYSGSINSQYIPGSSYTVTNTYTTPSGNDTYISMNHCVAGVGCVPVGTGHGWVEDDSSSDASNPSSVSPLSASNGDPSAALPAQVPVTSDIPPAQAIAPSDPPPDTSAPQSPLIVIPQPDANIPQTEDQLLQWRLPGEGVSDGVYYYQQSPAPVQDASFNQDNSTWSQPSQLIDSRFNDPGYINNQYVPGAGPDPSVDPPSDNSGPAYNDGDEI
jgi:hypothetical protein